MGYFSQAAVNATGREERSYPSPVLQLEWRLEDLSDRLKEIDSGAGEYRARHTEDDLAYALPKDLPTREAVLAAIEVARSRLGRSDLNAVPAENAASEEKPAEAA